MENKHKIQIIQFLITVLLTAIVGCFTLPLWMNNSVTVYFDSTAEKDIEYQILYTEDIYQLFDDKHSVKYTVKAGDRKVKIDLPVANIVGFAFNAGDNLKKISISNMKIVGKGISVLDSNNFELVNIDKYDVLSEKTYDTTRYTDSYVVYKKAIDLPARKKINWYRVIIISVLTFLSIYKLVQYLTNLKMQKNKPMIDILMLAVFFTLLFLPMSNITDAEKSVQENRMLVEKPHFSLDGKNENNYGIQFDAWFSDRFFGRYFLTKLYRIGQYLMGLNYYNKVYVGKDKFLFSRWFYVDDRIRNTNLFSNEELREINTQLYLLNDYAKRRNIAVYIEINPDKESIYGEYLPDFFYKANSMSRREQFINSIGSFSNIHIISQVDTLLRAKEDDLVFSKAGTHPTQWGVYNMYLNLINSMRADFDNIPAPLPLYMLKRDKKIYADVDILGNLGIPYFMYGYQNINDVDYVPPALGYKYTNATKYKSTGAEGFYDEIYIHEKQGNVNMPRLVVFGDSFSIRYKKYFPFHFSDIVHVYTGHGRNFELDMYLAAIDAYKPDIILISTTECFLPRFKDLGFHLNYKD